MSDETCEFCHWFSRYETYDMSRHEMVDYGQGLCLRMPPDSAGMRSKAEKHWSCGEFRQKEQKSEKN